MLDISFIRENPEKVKKGVETKQMDSGMVDIFLELDGQRKKLLHSVEKLRGEKNKAAKEQDKNKGKEIKTQLQKLEPELKKVEEKYKKILWEIPNIPAEDVKVGKDESENEMIRKEGKPTKFDFEPKDHLDLGEKLDIIDVKRAAKVSGTRFGYLKGDAALLEFALVNFAMEFLVKEGFVPVIPPVLLKKESMDAMGYLMHGMEEDMYVLENDNMVLAGTSEQAIGPMHMDEVLVTKDLPLRYVGFSSCFRREAGTYGKDTRGILRVHQFDKVEMFSFTKEEESDKEHEYLLGLEEKMLQKLEIPYQVIKMCTGDIGVPFTRKYDLEAWIPSQKKYRELTSASNAGDWQARRLNTRYSEKGETKYAHMLNGTAVAMGRTIIAIMENYQQKDGSIKIPKILQKWMGKAVIDNG